MRIATIDIGTNSVLLLVAERRADGGVRVVEDRCEITRLGEGVDRTGRLADGAVARTLAAVESHVAAARAAGAQRIAAVGTQALREAANAEAFVAPAEAALGGAIEIVSGAREAELSRRAVMESFPALAEGVATIVDVGGGSTEFVVVEHGQVAFVTSVKLGSVRLTERFLAADPPAVGEIGALRAHVRATLAAVPARGTVVGIAGTVTTMAAIARGIVPYDAERVHGMVMPRAEVGAVAARLCAVPLAERREIPGLEPRRADVICGGALLVEEILAHAGAAELLVSDRGVRWGLWYELSA